MNDRLEIASRLIAGDLANPLGCRTHEEISCLWALELADTLIKMERETQRKEDKEEVLWMIEEPKIWQMVFYVDDRSLKKYFKALWYRSEFDMESFKSNQVFESEAKIRKFLKLD